MDIHIRIVKVPGFIDITGELDSNLPSTEIVRTLFFLEKDFNMLHQHHRMHIDLGDGPEGEPVPAA